MLVPLLTALADALARVRRRIIPAKYAALELGTGAWVSGALAAACDLDLPCALEREPLSSAQLAERGYGDADRLERLLLALAAYGIFARLGNAKYTLTRVGRALVGPESIAPMIRYANASWHTAAYAHLAQSIREGGTGFASAHGGAELFEYLSHDAHAGATFDAGMRAMSHAYGDAIAHEIRIGAHDRVVDIGGGDGTLLRRILARYPDVRATVFEVAAVAQAYAGGSDIAFVQGDVRAEPPPEADVYLLSHVLHDWDDASCVKMLQNVRRAMKAPSRLVIVELIKRTPSNRWSMDRTSDLEMLAMLPGRERNLREFEALLTPAKLRIRRVMASAVPEAAIECVPV